jgi:hypothetical protein
MISGAQTFSLPRLTIRIEPTLVLFGDESTAKDIVTYGIVATQGEIHHGQAQAAWNQVIRTAGCPDGTRVHAREIFSGHARAKSPWHHLTETLVEKFAVDLMAALKAVGAGFFLGAVFKDTYPSEGVPSGLNANGQQTFVPLTDEVAYGFGFAAAVAGLNTGNPPPMPRGTKYKLYIDRMEARRPLWGPWGNVAVRRLMEGTGMVPTRYDEKPLLIDAADLFAYSSARAVSDGEARNKAVCERVFQICAPSITRFFWSPGDLTPELKARLRIS